MVDESSWLDYTHDIMAKMNIPLHFSPVFQGTANFPDGEKIQWVDKTVPRRENSREQSSKPNSVIS